MREKKGSFQMRKKKIISMLSAILMLCMVFSTQSLAYTKDSEWSRGIGGSLIDITEDGVKLPATENGLSTWIYKQDPIDITDFSVTFTLSQNYWWPGHNSDIAGYYDALFLLNKNTFSGSKGPFLLLQPLDAGTLRIEGQIVNCGLLLSPTYVIFNVDTTQPITLRGKLLDDSHYRFSIDGDENNFYDFEIPINYPFHTDLEGKGYFCFGVASNDTTATGNSITVTSVNGIDFTGVDPKELEEPEEPDDTKEPAETDKTPTAPTDNKTDTDKTDTNKNDSKTDDNASSSAVNVILLVCIGVLVLVIIAGVLFYFLYIRKKMEALKNGTDTEKQ